MKAKYNYIYSKSAAFQTSIGIYIDHISHG